MKYQTYNIFKANFDFLQFYTIFATKMAFAMSGAYLSCDNRARNVPIDMFLKFHMVVAFDKDGRTTPYIPSLGSRTKKTTFLSVLNLFKLIVH